MKDCVGKEISIGDKVICSDMHYADLLIGEIIGFTPKKARVRYVRSEHIGTYGKAAKKEQLKESYQIFVCDKVMRGFWAAYLEDDLDREYPIPINEDDLYDSRRNLWNYGYPMCSVCHNRALLNGAEESVLSEYCPHCGAKMDGGTDNEQA